MSNKFEHLNHGEVLSVSDSAQIFIGHHTFRVSEFAESIKAQLECLGGWSKEKDGWFSEKGIDCEVLRYGATDWQKGKVRISIEFCPLESNSQNPTVETKNHVQSQADFAQTPKNIEVLADNPSLEDPWQ